MAGSEQISPEHQHDLSDRLQTLLALKERVPGVLAGYDRAKHIELISVYKGQPSSHYQTATKRSLEEEAKDICGVLKRWNPQYLDEQAFFKKVDTLLPYACQVRLVSGIAREEMTADETPKLIYATDMLGRLFSHYTILPCTDPQESSVILSPLEALSRRDARLRAQYSEHSLPVEQYIAKSKGPRLSPIVDIKKRQANDRD